MSAIGLSQSKYFRRAYTLVELVAVAGIIASMLGVSMLYFREPPASLRLERVRRSVMLLAAEARRLAAAERRTTVMIYSVPEASFEVPGLRRIKLEEEISAEINGTAAAGEAVEVFRFFPDGRSPATELRLFLEEEVLRLWISPLTGTLECDEHDAA